MWARGMPRSRTPPTTTTNIHTHTPLSPQGAPRGRCRDCGGQGLPAWAMGDTGREGLGGGSFRSPLPAALRMPLRCLKAHLLSLPVHILSPVPRRPVPAGPVLLRGLYQPAPPSASQGPARGHPRVLGVGVGVPLSAARFSWQTPTCRARRKSHPPLGPLHLAECGGEGGLSGGQEGFEHLNKIMEQVAYIGCHWGDRGTWPGKVWGVSSHREGSATRRRVVAVAAGADGGVFRDRVGSGATIGRWGEGPGEGQGYQLLPSPQGRGAE